MFVTPGYAATTETPAPAGEGTTEAGTEHAGEHGLFPPFDPSHYPSQILWLAIIFGLFYLFLKRMALPRVGSILEVRSQRISQDLDQAARMKGEADAAVAAYEQELAEARAKANAIGQAATNAAKAEAEQQTVRAREVLREQVAALAVKGAEQILRKEVNAGVHAELLNRLKTELQG